MDYLHTYRHNFVIKRGFDLNLDKTRLATKQTNREVNAKKVPNNIFVFLRKSPLKV